MKGVISVGGSGLDLSDGVVRVGVQGGRNRALAAEEKMSAGVRPLRVGVRSCFSGVLRDGWCPCLLVGVGVVGRLLSKGSSSKRCARPSSGPSSSLVGGQFSLSAWSSVNPESSWFRLSLT